MFYFTCNHGLNQIRSHHVDHHCGAEQYLLTHLLEIGTGLYVYTHRISGQLGAVASVCRLCSNQPDYC